VDYNGMPKPLQPHMPLLIAGGGKRMLTLAAREANIVGLLPRMIRSGFAEGEDGVDSFREKAEFVRNQAGDRANHLEFNILVQMLSVTDDRQREIERLAAEYEIDSLAWFDSPMIYVGTVEEICDQLRAVRDQVGASYFVVFEPAMDDFAPIVKALAWS